MQTRKERPMASLTKIFGPVALVFLAACDGGSGPSGTYMSDQDPQTLRDDDDMQGDMRSAAGPQG
jgi:hypothetical protein